MQEVYYLLLERNDVNLNVYKGEIVHQIVSKRAARIIARRYYKVRIMITICNRQDDILINDFNLAFIPKSKSTTNIQYIYDAISSRKKLHHKVIQVFTYNWELLHSDINGSWITYTSDKIFVKQRKQMDNSLQYFNTTFLFSWMQ